MRHKMTDEHKAKIAIGRTKRKADNHFNLELGDTGYAIKRFDKWNYVVYKDGKSWKDTFFPDIPSACKYILRKTESHEIKELLNKWNQIAGAVIKAMEKNNVK